MVDRFYGYQYDTNPKKLSQEYTPFKNRYSNREESVSSVRSNSMKNSKNSEIINPTERRNRYKAKTSQDEQYVPVEKVPNRSRRTNRSSNEMAKPKKNKSAKIVAMPKMKIVMLLITSFSVLFAISYQNSLISESFNKKEQYKKEMEALSKTNQQMEVNIENSLNLNNIEQAAKEKLGMQKLTNDQKVYVNLPKQDYVAPASEQVVMDEDIGFFEKLIKGFTKSVN